MSEIVEIISKECQERGVLLSNIWNIHTSLVNACLSRYENEKNTQYSSFLAEIEKIKSSYSSTFEVLMKENKENRVILEDRDYAIKKLIHDNTSLKRKEQRLNKTIQNLGDAVNEFKEMFDNILAENIKLKLSKEEESNLRKGERDILKRQYDEMLKNKNKLKESLFQKVEKLIKPQTMLSSPSPSKDFMSRRSFAFEADHIDVGYNNVGSSLDTLRDIYIKDTIEEDDPYYDDDFDNMNELFTREIGVDTKDLLPVNNKETTTKDLGKLFLREQSAQTVYFDEINEENENFAEKLIINENSDEKRPFGKMRGSYINTGDVILENMVEGKKDLRTVDKQFLLKKRMFSFSNESLEYLEKFKEIQSYTLTGICEWYSKEIENFFAFIKELSDNIHEENFFQILREFDWESFSERIIKTSMAHEQFIKNIKNKDTARSKEILQHKIELLERKIEMEEAEKMRNLFKSNYNKLREKFEEFYRMTIKIQSLEEDEEEDELDNKNSTTLQTGNSLEQSTKRRKSMTYMAKEKVIEEVPKKKGKTIIKQKSPEIKKKKDDKEIFELSVTKTSSKTQTGIKKFDEMNEKMFENKKITNYSLKKPAQEEVKEKAFSNSNISAETKAPLKIDYFDPKRKLSLENFDPKTKLSQEFSKPFIISELEEFPENNEPITQQKPSEIQRKVVKEKTHAHMVQGSLVKNPLISAFTEEPEDIISALKQIDKEKNEVLKLEEKHYKEQQELKDLISNEKMIDLINQANNVLPKKKTWDKISSKNADKCYAFMHRIEVSTIISSKKVTLATVLKTVSQVLTELVKIKQKKQGNLNPLFFILYEFLFQRYGNARDRAEAKMIKIFQGCMGHLDLPKVRIFTRLLSVLPEKNSLFTSIYDGNDLDFYLQYFMLLDDHPMSNTPGIMLAMSPQEHAFTALSRAIEVFTKYTSNYSHIISKVRLENIINQIKAVKLDDPIVSRKYVVDVDFVLEKIFEIRNEVFIIYKLPFLAVDIDDNETLDINEFILLLRNIERNKFTEKQIIEIFKNEYDFFDFLMKKNKKNAYRSNDLRFFVRKRTSLGLKNKRYSYKKSKMKSKTWKN